MFTNCACSETFETQLIEDGSGTWQHVGRGLTVAIGKISVGAVLQKEINRHLQPNILSWSLRPAEDSYVQRRFPICIHRVHRDPAGTAL